MATYFAIPFEGIQYQPPQFWTAFAVLFTTSSIGLVIFGILSGTQEAGPLYKSLTQSRLDVWRTIRGKREKRLE